MLVSSRACESTLPVAEARVIRRLRLGYVIVEPLLFKKVFFVARLGAFRLMRAQLFGDGCGKSVSLL